MSRGGRGHPNDAPDAARDGDGFRVYRTGETYEEYCARAREAGCAPSGWVSWYVVMHVVPTP